MNKLLVIFVLIILDFITKKIVFNYINLNSFIPIIFILDLAHIHNYGISFGFFAGLIPPWIIISIASFFTIFIIYMMIQSSNEIEKWGLSLVIAGAVSNIADRALNNYVLDFIYLHYKEYYWPAFNFADVYITFGIFMILYQILKEFRKKL